MLTRLIYTSQATRKINAPILRSILASSRRWNAAEFITGMLCSNDWRFIQYIEGERSKINVLYDMIIHDSRHHSLVLLDYCPISKRAFNDWSLGYISLLDKNDLKTVRAATFSTEFAPETLHPAQALKLMLSLKSQLKDQVVITIPE